MMHMHMNRAGMYLMNMASGTSMNPCAAQRPMIMTEAGNWSLMFMGQAFIVNTQQSGPRAVTTNSIQRTGSWPVPNMRWPAAASCSPP